MQTLSKNKISQIASLQQKKFRLEHNEFLVEGKKSVQDFLRSGFEASCVVIAKEELLSAIDVREDIVFLAGDKDRQKISALSTAPEMMAVFKMPQHRNEGDWKNTFSLVLDGVRDPGNLGTIIRTADWFGIQNIYCSLDCVDCFNPKVVQATMGSLARVKIYYFDLPLLMKEALQEKSFVVMGAYMEGENVNDFKFTGKGFLVMGNESEGIRTDVAPFISQKISIPKANSSNAESLNVSIATAILCHSLKR
ncbi:MAG: TrmH family RNA methyltransferase [Flavobacteriales bacterium]